MCRRSEERVLSSLDGCITTLKMTRRRETQYRNRSMAKYSGRGDI
jgi:hypothetical protein